MLLVGIDAAAFTYRKCLASEVFVIAMISQESTESKVWSDVVTTFEAHTPSAGFISEMVAQGEVELPIDIGITVIGQFAGMAKTRARAATASTLIEIYFIVFILVIVLNDLTTYY